MAGIYVLKSIPPFYTTAPGSAGADAAEAQLLTVAHALVSSPPWASMHSAALVVRPHPYPVLAFIGDFTPEENARLEALHWQLSNLIPHLRYVPYEQAEQDCLRLVQKLIDRFGADELRGFRFVAIPRGGCLVLGMVAYLLGLDHDRLVPPASVATVSPDRPLVIVDDCALTGARFGEFLRNATAQDVVFAHLYSHPDLRAAIVEQHSRVIACLSAQDLHDHAPERFGADYPAWRERWRARSGESCSWVGLPDYICFAWNEPDIGIWNEVTQKEERGWHLLPPPLCLKNRSIPGACPAIVQVQSEGPGPLKPTDHVVFGDLGSRVIVSDLEAKSTFALEAVAADMWRALARHGNLDAVVTAILEDYAIDEVTLRADLNAFVADLLKKGLLEDTDEREHPRD